MSSPQFFRSRSHHAGGIWRRIFISSVRPSVYTKPEKLSTKNRAFENALENGGIWKRSFFVLVWTENIMKMEFFETDDVTIIRWFVCLSLPQTQIQNGGRNGDCHVDFATWAQLKTFYAHAHMCTQAFMSPVIVAFSNFSPVVWKENVLSVF